MISCLKTYFAGAVVASVSSTRDCGRRRRMANGWEREKLVNLYSAGHKMQTHRYPSQTEMDSRHIVTVTMKRNHTHDFG